MTRHGIDVGLLERLESLIVCDLLPSATVERAHFLLPGCAPAEKRGSFTNVHGRVQRFMQAVEPPGDARPEVEWLIELTAHLTGRRPADTLEGLFNEMARSVPAFDGLTWAGLGETGLTVPVA